jgi:aminoglycoside phosphotransferase (APT) family kinase protein
MSESMPRAVLAAHFPEREVVTVEQVAEGNRRETVVVRFSANAPVVIQWTEASDALRTETALMGAIRSRTTVPVPETLVVGARDGLGYVVREHRGGNSLHTMVTSFDTGTRTRLVRTFGRYLGELHAAFPVDGVGRVSVTGGTAAGNASGSGEWTVSAPSVPPKEWLIESGERAIARLPVPFDPLRDRLQACVRSVADQSPATARLFPWDLRPGNALVADGEITAVVDWEEPLAAPPGLAAAKARYLTASWYDVDTPRLREAFKAGYESVRPWPTVQPAHGVAAIAASAVDSDGCVTNPGYPPYDRGSSVAFHRAALERALPD